jgi:hypothetical protein
MKKVLPLLLLVFVLCQCSPVKREKRPATPREQYPEKFTTDYVNQSAKKLIDYVPDHEFNPSIKRYFNEEYYSLLEESWAVPVDDIMGIGENEWLYYFMTGNGGDEEFMDHSKNILETVVMDDYNAWVQMEYLGRIHDIVMHFENEDWVISNFDGTKDQMLRYIRDQRTHLRNINWQQYYDVTIEDNKAYIPEEEIVAMLDEFKAEVNAYLAKYPDR